MYTRPGNSKHKCNSCKKIVKYDDLAPQGRSDGPKRSMCKDCRREQRSKNAKTWRKKNIVERKKYERNWWLVSNFGITVDEFDSLLKKQNGKCAICKKAKCSTGKNFAVDHDHKTGKIRGLLCRNCNVGLGMLGDNKENVKNALEYLESQ